MQPTPAPKRLLVVEDNEVAREGLAAVLRPAGYEVILASNGQEALNVLATGPAPDLILLDMLLPVLDGWQFLNLTRSQGRPPPIIVTTGTILTPEWARDYGCQGFLRKPIDADALLEEVRRCLDSDRALR
jgi:CheY-like chemotaxis protein